MAKSIKDLLDAEGICISKVASATPKKSVPQEATDWLGGLLTKEAIEGGKADGHSDSEYPKDQLDKGIEVEMEHTNSKAQAKEITKDHLEEEKELDPDKKKDDLEYYDKLEDMEDDLKKSACGDMQAHLQKVKKKNKGVDDVIKKLPREKRDDLLRAMRQNPEAVKEGSAFRRGFEKAAEDVSGSAHTLSPSLLRALLAGGAGAAAGGVLGSAAGKKLMSMRPLPIAESGASKLFAGMSPSTKRSVMDLLKELGKTRGAAIGALGLGSVGAYFGSRPSLD